MTAIRVQAAASLRLDDIHRHTRNRWGAEQADRCITGMFEAFEKIKSHDVVSRPIPAEFGVGGFFFRCRNHFVHWRHLPNGDIGIVTVLHARMHQIQRFRDDFEIG